jgi:hypothetical protein
MQPYKLVRFTLALLLMFPAPIEATSFVLVRVGTKLYIGADACRVDYSSHLCKPVCKIAVHPGAVTLTWGLIQAGLRSGKQWDDFSIQVNAVSASNGTVTEKRDRLMLEAKAFILRAMQLRDSHSSLPVTPESMANYGVGAAFISMQMGVPHIAAFDLKIKNWEAREIEESTHPELPSWDWSIPFAFGNSQAFGEIVQKDGIDSVRTRARTEPTAFINRVLSRQHEITPNDVGPPYAIAVLSDSTFALIQEVALIQEGACREVSRFGVPASQAVGQ